MPYAQIFMHRPRSSMLPGKTQFILASPIGSFHYGWSIFSCPLIRVFLSSNPPSSAFIPSCLNQSCPLNSNPLPFIPTSRGDSRTRWEPHLFLWEKIESIRNWPHLPRRAYHSGDPFYWRFGPRQQEEAPEAGLPNPSDSITRCSLLNP